MTTQIQKRAYGTSHTSHVQTNRLSANPTPLATINQPNHRLKPLW